MSATPSEDGQTLRFEGGSISLTMDGRLRCDFEGGSVETDVFSFMHSVRRGQGLLNEDRRMFAAMAMQGMCSTDWSAGRLYDFDQMAKDATVAADALLKELAK